MLLLRSYKGPVYPSRVILSQNTVEMYAGATFDLDVKVVPANTSFKSIQWISDDPSIVDVDANGNLIGKLSGTVTIRAKAYGGIEDTCNVTCTYVVPTSVSLNYSTYTLEKDKTIQLKATVNPSTAANKNVTWSSSNSSIASVNNDGLVTYKGDGNATITCTTVEGGKSATCTITCQSAWLGTCCYGYTGNVQTFTAPGTQKYKIEVWGAQGGCNGGYGGYSCGTVSLTKGAVLNIYVGGCGLTCSSMSSSTAYCTPGGWNGGGNAWNTCYSGTSTYTGGGGGGTDVRYNGTTLCHRFIVAGGGGGNTSNSMCAGTYRAGGGECGCGSCRGYQTSSYGGSFGQGMHGCSGTNYKYHAGGGGGGWYGGGTSTCHSDSYNCGACASGGSGFVYNSTYCGNHPNKACLGGLALLTSAATCSGAGTIPTPTGGTSTGRSGCGYAKITGISG